MGTSVVDARRDAPHAFTSTAADVRGRRTWAGLAVVVAVAVVAAALAIDARHDDRIEVPPELQAGRVERTTTTTKPGDPPTRHVFATDLAAKYSDLPAFAGVPWADQLHKDEAGVVNGTVTSKYVNIQHGRRVTLKPSCDCPHVTLWLSGGSAAFGTGQRDDHTIASDLVRIAEERDGIALDVQNRSHDGYTFQMEVEWEIEQSLRTDDAPDLLVFYNGWNDAMAELAQEYLRGPDPNRAMSMILPPDLDAINEDTDAFMQSDVGAASGRAAAERYLRVQRQVEADTADTRTRTFYFFQADALSSARQLRDYEQINGIPTKEMQASPLADTLDAMTKALGRHVVSLRHEFDDVDQSTFLGLVHQNEVGAEIVAEAIYRKIRPQVLAAAK